MHTAESLMQDGLLETRLHAKQALAQLKRLVEQHGPPGSFANIVARLGSAANTPRTFVRNQYMTESMLQRICSILARVRQ